MDIGSVPGRTRHSGRSPGGDRSPPARLSANTNKLLSASSVFDGDIDLRVAATVGDLDEDAALDGLDEALDAQLLQPAGGTDVYRFTHALIRHTLANELSPSRRARLHLRAAKALVGAAGSSPTPAAAAEIAVQFHRSRALPGAAAGVEFALIAADHSETTGGQAEAARFLQLALDLMPRDDPRRARILGRLGMALIWGLDFDAGLATAIRAGEAIGAAEGRTAAAEYLAGAALAMGFTGNDVRAWTLASEGLRSAGDRRDLSWAHLFVIDSQRRDFGDSEYPGIPRDTPERWEAARIIRAARRPDLAAFGGILETPVASREEALASSRNLTILVCFAGEFASSLPVALKEAQASLARGQAVRAARCFMQAAFCQLSLGRLLDGRASVEQAERFAERTGTAMFGVLHARELLTAFLDDEVALETVNADCARLAPALVPAQAWAIGPAYAICARTTARLGRRHETLEYLDRLLPWLERAPAWANHFPHIAGYSAETLWLLNQVDHVPLVERAVRERVLAPDFRDIGVDSRLSLARLCTLQGRYDEARGSFAEARRVLLEQGARPLLAIADFDEALMYLARDERGDNRRARRLVDDSRRAFEAIGMTGWIRRADELSRRLT